MLLKILFLDQSGKLGGAEISLTDVAKYYRNNCLVGLFADGSFRDLLEQEKIPVRVLTTQPIQVSKDSGILQSLKSINAIVPLILQVTQIARNYDLIYANTQKAFIVGALASFLSRRPLVYHLRDILSADHFSQTNRQIAVTLANRCASLVIANSQATRKAFIEAGGRADIAKVVYNGFDPQKYRAQQTEIDRVRQQFGLEGKFVVGHFSRLSPWKGQHVLIEALTYCPKQVIAILVGDALFGEQDYVAQLRQQVAELGLKERVQFLGFRSDVVPLMAARDLVAHTSTSPEPFGRVIIEAMLCRTPVVAAAAGGVVELVEQDKTGWLVKPGDVLDLATTINTCYQQSESTATIVQQAQLQASEHFHFSAINQQIAQLLYQVRNLPKNN